MYALVPPSPEIRSVQDEWGMFDPNQAGLKAAFRAARALNRPSDDDLAEAADAEDAARAAAPSPALQPVARAISAPPIAVPIKVPTVPIAAREQAVPERVLQPVLLERPAAPVAIAPATAKDNLDDLADPQAVPRRTATVDRGAVYTLEFPTKCPQCASEIAPSKSNVVGSGTVGVSRKEFASQAIPIPHRSREYVSGK